MGEFRKNSKFWFSQSQNLILNQSFLDFCMLDHIIKFCFLQTICSTCVLRSTLFVAITPLRRALPTPYANHSIRFSPKAINGFILFFVHQIRPFIQPQKAIFRSRNYHRCYSKIVTRFIDKWYHFIERPKFDVCIFTFHKHCYFHSMDPSNHYVLWFLLLQGIDPKNKEGKLQEKRPY